VIQQASLLSQAARGDRAGKSARRGRCPGGRSSRFRPGARPSLGTASMPEWASRRATAPAWSGCVGACAGHLARATASARPTRDRGDGGIPTIAG
jgi:hypothetical protein